MHADAFRAQLVRHVAGGAFQRRLHRPHDVVVLDHLVGAVIAHGDQRAAVLHQRLGQARHLDEGVARDAHRLQEAVARAVGDAAVQVVHRAEGDGVHHEVDLAPGFLDRGEHLFQLAVSLHVQRQDQRCGQAFGQRAHEFFRLLVEVGDGDFGALFPHDLGATVGDAVLVGDTDNQTAFAGEGQVGWAHADQLQ
ncbi:hypothetical protein D3C72_1744050 [compost metagenome]